MSQNVPKQYCFFSFILQGLNFTTCQDYIMFVPLFTATCGNLILRTVPKCAWAFIRFLYYSFFIGQICFIWVRTKHQYEKKNVGWNDCMYTVYFTDCKIQKKRGYWKQRNVSENHVAMRCVLLRRVLVTTSPLWIFNNLMNRVFLFEVCASKKTLYYLLVLKMFVWVVKQNSYIFWGQLR